VARTPKRSAPRTRLAASAATTPIATPDGRESEPLPHDEAYQVGSARTECEADAHLAGALRHRVGDHAVDAHRGEQQGRPAEGEQQQHREARLGDRAVDDLPHRAHVGDREVRVHRVQRAPHRRGQERGVASGAGHDREGPHAAASEARELRMRQVELRRRVSRSPPLRTSRTTPTTVVHTTESLDRPKRFPIAFPPGQSVRAIVSLTSATSGASASSPAVMPRPRANATRIASSAPGVTTCGLGDGTGAPGAVGLPSTTMFQFHPVTASGSRRTAPAASTPGSARMRSSSSAYAGATRSCG
jgi:hypothetical protein